MLIDKLNPGLSGEYKNNSSVLTDLKWNILIKQKLRVELCGIIGY
jgi:hypothetical protein